LIERGQTNKQEDIRAVICDFGLAVTKTNVQTTSSGFYFFLNNINNINKIK